MVPTNPKPLSFEMALQCVQPSQTASTYGQAATTTTTTWQAYMSPSDLQCLQSVLAQGPDAFADFLQLKVPMPPPQSSNVATTAARMHLVALRTRAMLTEQWLSCRGKVDKIRPARIDDVYDTLEDDLSSMVLWRAACRSTQETMSDSGELAVNASVDGSTAASPAEASALPADEPIDAIPGIGSIKHLITAIDRSHYATSAPAVSPSKLLRLLHEIKPSTAASTSKWANDDRVGQAELYEVCEKILEDLRNYKQHSFPFLNKVIKRDAPDYYDVIRNPMDLGTMGKKLKAIQYSCKEEFEADLALIWDNCMHYNSDPASIYRVHATAMRELSEKLLRQVPNISIRSRAELEADGFDSDHITYTDWASPGTVQNDAPVDTGSVTSALDTQADSADDVPLLQRMAFMNVARNEQLLSHRQIQEADAAEMSIDAQPVDAVDITDSSCLRLFPSVDDDYLPATNDPIEAQIFHLTIESKSEILWNRLFQSSLPIGDQELLSRSQYDMRHYDECNRTHQQSNSLFVPELFHLTSAFPDLYSPPLSPLTPSSSRLLERRCFIPPQSCRLIVDSVETLRECRRLERKILEFAHQTTSADIDQAGADDDDEPDAEIKLRIPSIDDDRSKSPEPLLATAKSLPLIGEPAAHALLKRAISMLLLQAGFEKGTAQCMQVLAEVAGRYIVNIGSLFKHYLEYFGTTMPIDDIMMHTLYECGVRSAGSLEYSVRTEPQRTRAKLCRVRRSLQNCYNVIMTPSDDEAPVDEVQDEDQPPIDGTVESSNSKNGAVDADDDVAFLMGNFGPDLGDDYLGLKELGIDVGATNTAGAPPLAVPEHMWNPEKRTSKIRRMRKKRGHVLRTLLATVGGVAEVDDDLNAASGGGQFAEVPKFPPFDDMSSHIRLFREFYQRKFKEAADEPLVEDEFHVVKVKSKKKRRSPKKPVDWSRSAGTSKNIKQTPPPSSNTTPLLNGAGDEQQTPGSRITTPASNSLQPPDKVKRPRKATPSVRANSQGKRAASTGSTSATDSGWMETNSSGGGGFMLE